MPRDSRVWLPPNRRHLHRGLFLPSRQSARLRLAVLLDTSGSTVRVQPAFLGELAASSVPRSTTSSSSCKATPRCRDGPVRFGTPWVPGRPSSWDSRHQLRARLRAAGAGGATALRVHRAHRRHGTPPRRAPSFPVIWALVPGGTAPVPWGRRIVLSDGKPVRRHELLPRPRRVTAAFAGVELGRSRRWTSARTTPRRRPSSSSMSSLSPPAATSCASRSRHRSPCRSGDWVTCSFATCTAPATARGLLSGLRTPGLRRYRHSFESQGARRSALRPSSATARATWPRPVAGRAGRRWVADNLAQTWVGLRHSLDKEWMGMLGRLFLPQRFTPLWFPPSRPRHGEGFWFLFQAGKLLVVDGPKGRPRFPSYPTAEPCPCPPPIPIASALWTELPVGRRRPLDRPMCSPRDTACAASAACSVGCPRSGWRWLTRPAGHRVPSHPSLLRRLRHAQRATRRGTRASLSCLRRRCLPAHRACDDDARQA